jgi:DNA polymerase-3 subunit delta'
VSEIDGQPDQLDGYPHPREAARLVGHDAAVSAFLAGWETGRQHHAWLLGGPEGVGKATFAYLMAKLMLGVSRSPGPGLGVDERNPAARLVTQLAHPDLVAIRRGLTADGKKVAQDISVSVVRRAIESFSATAALGGWRVGVVDSADDLNRNSANALLKLIEEPPARTVFLIVAHRPHQVLPTIRSRCRKLDFAPLADDEVAQVLEAASPRTPQGERARAARLGEGSVRRALRRLDPETLALVDGARGLLDAMPRHDRAAALALAEGLQGRRNDEAFAVFLETLEAWMQAQLRSNASLGPHRLAPLAELWEKAARAARETDVLNLDRRPLVLSILSDLSDAVMRMRRG